MQALFFFSREQCVYTFILSSIELEALVQEILAVTGNALSVPVVGAVLRSIFIALTSVSSLATPLLLQIRWSCTGSLSTPGGPGTDEQKSLHDARKSLKRKLAHQIAISDGLRIKFRQLACKAAGQPLMSQHTG